MSSNFGAQNASLQVLLQAETRPDFLLQVLARFRNSRESTQILAVAGPTALHSEPGPNCLAPSIGRDSKHGAIAVPQVLAVPKRSHNHARNAFPVSTGGSQKQQWARRNRFHPSTGIFQNPPYCIQSHAENALPRVLTGFRPNQRHRGNAFPEALAVPGPTEKVFSSSTGSTTNDPDEPRTRACGGAWWPFPGCRLRGAARKEIRCLPRGVGKLGRSH